MSSPIIRTSKLRKSYGKLVALDNLNIEVQEGSIFGLLGPNGAGKSTTFGLLCGWLSPSSGLCEVLGASSRESFKLQGQVAALPQDAHFPERLPILQELAHLGVCMGWSHRDSIRRAENVLEQVQLPEVRDKRCRELSHGMLKRVFLAQALMGNPKVVLLDEPVAGLDPKTARGMKDLIKSLAPSSTVVISSHNLSDIQELCTHGLILDHGRVVAEGTIQELTGQDAELTIYFKPTPDFPREELAARFDNARIRLEQKSDRGIGEVTIGFEASLEPSDVVATAMRFFLERGIGVMEIRQGRSLESAFLEAVDP